MRLGDLRGMSGTELDELYLSASTPEVEELEGNYDGLLLVGQFPPRAGQFGISFVNQPWLPWKGKVFYPSSGARGRGANRFALGGMHRETWQFETAIVPSMFGGEPALLIDYDIPDSPLWMKGVFDELKKLDEQLYLGKGGIKIGGANRFVFTWGMERV